MEDALLEITPRRIKPAADLTGSFRPERHLDIGCGSGLLLRELQGVVDCVGLERSERLARLCDVNMVVIGDACNLPFVENTFDSVSALEVIEHMSAATLDAMICNLYGSLKIGGVATISTPFYDFRSIVCDPAWYFGHRHFSRLDLFRLFSSSRGWEWSFTEVKGGWWEIFTMLNYYILRYIFNKNIFMQDWFEKRRDLEYPKYSQAFTTIHAQFIKKSY